MTDEKTLPQDESANGHDEGPIPATRDGRIKLATEKGGLKSCPASFSNEYLDWEIIKSDNPFEILYLDYRALDRITRAMIDGNFGVVKKFWTDIVAKSMSSPPVAKKYGGIDSIRRYQQILQRAYAELTTDTNAPKQCYEQIIQKKLGLLNPEINSLLRQGEYTPDIGSHILQRGHEIGLADEDISVFLLGILHEMGFAPEREDSNAPLSVRWLSKKKLDEIKRINIEKLKNEFDSIIEGILADGEFEPRELSAVREKGKKLGYGEEESLIYFAQEMRKFHLSPDPDGNIKETDTIAQKLSVIWRTEEKHLEISAHKFRAFLDGKLLNGIYNPDDYVSITEAAAGFLRRDAVKLKETLLNYLKEKEFKPVRKFQLGHDLTVEWKTSWAKLDPKPVPIFKIALVLGLILIVVFNMIKPPPPPLDLASLTINTQPAGAVVFLNGDRKGNSPMTINDLKKGNYTVRLDELKGYKSKEENVTLSQKNQILDFKLEKQNTTGDPPPPLVKADILDLKPSMVDMNFAHLAGVTGRQEIYLMSEYRIVTKSRVTTVEVEENNYLVMPDGTQTPDSTEIVQRSVGVISVRRKIQLPDTILPGIYTHVATVRVVGDKINKAEQRVQFAGSAPPESNMKTTILDFRPLMLDVNNRPIESFVPGQTIKMASEYTVVATPDVDNVEIEENNYLVMPDGTKTPDVIRKVQRGVGRVRANISITLPNEILPGMYTHVAIVRIGDVVNKAEHSIRVGSESSKINPSVQQEINTYLSEGIMFFQKGKYELCIEKMKEVIKRDKNNVEAQNYIKRSNEEMDVIRGKFTNPVFGGSE